MQNRIKELRKSLNLTQAEFGASLGVADSTVGNWEKARQVPPPSMIVSICKAFNVNREWLETGAGEMFVKEESLDDAARMRRMVGDLFEMLPEDKQKIIYDAVQNWIKKYGDKKEC